MSKQEFERKSALNGLDEGVSRAIVGMQQAEAERHLTKKEREKKRKQEEVARKEKERLAKRNRLMIDLRTDINLVVEDIATREGVSVSAVVNLACLRLIGDDHSNEIDWLEYKRPSNSPRFEWTIYLPPI